MGGMDERKENRRALAFLISLFVVLLPGLYVFAIGPAHWLMDHGYIRTAIFDAVYGPFIAVVKVSPSIQSIVVWYIDLWVDS